MHIAAGNSSAVAMALLLKGNPNITSQDSNGNTPLHVSAMEGSVTTMDLLLSTGSKICLEIKNKNGLTPIFLSKTNDIVLLLLQMNAVTNLENPDAEPLTGGDPSKKPLLAENGVPDPEKGTLPAQKKSTLAKKKDPKELVQYMLRHRREAVKPLLDQMVRKSEDNRLTIFDFSIFRNFQKKDKYLNLHDKVSKGKLRHLFRHPIMRFWVYQLWCRNKNVYLVNICMYFIFVFCLTIMGLSINDVLKCTETGNDVFEGTCSWGVGDRLVCNMANVSQSLVWDSLNLDKDLQDGLANQHTCPQLICHKNNWDRKSKIQDGLDLTFNDIRDCFGGVTEFANSWNCFWIVILLWLWLFVRELVQCVEAFRKGKAHFRSMENVLELAIIGSTLAFALILVLPVSVSIDVPLHLGGWCLFFAWVDLTLFLARLPHFGTCIYMSLYVTKSLVVAMVAYLPVLIAFSVSFNMFLAGSDIFRGYGSSFMKTFVMMVGELEFSNYFVYHKVDEFGGRNISAQVRTS